MDNSHQKYQQRIEALVEIGKRLTADIRLSEEEIFELIYEQASKKLGMENLSIALYDETMDTVKFVLAVVQGRRVDFETEQGWEPRTKGNGKTETIIHSKKHLWLQTQKAVKETKFSTIPGHKDSEEKTPNSWGGVPMIAGNRVLGVIANYGYGQDYLYNQEDIQILQALADKAAIAIANIRLLQAVYEISKITNMVRNLKELYELIDKIIGKLMYAKNFRIVKFDESGKISGHFHFKDERDDDRDSQKEIIEKGLTGYVYKTGKALISNRQIRNELIKHGKIEEDTGTASESWLGVRLQVNDKVVGVITVHSYVKEDAYGESEKNILMFVSEQIAMAIERVSLREESEKQRNQLEKRNEQHKALIDLAQKLTSSIQLKEKDIFEKIKGQLHGLLMEMDNMYIALYDESNDFVYFPLAFKNGQSTEITARKAGGGRTEEIIRTKKSIFIKTKNESENWYKQPGRSEYMGDTLASWLGVPMMIGEKVLGVVATYHPTKDYVYTEDDLKILQAMANIAAIALDNAKLFNDKEKLINDLEKLVIDLKDAQNGIANRERELVKSGIAMDFIHKMNNLAGTIPAWISLIKRKLKSESNPDPKIIEYLDKINRDTGLLLKEAHELKNPISEPEKIDMEEVVGTIVAQVEMMVLPDIKIIFNDPDDDLFPVYGIKEQIAVAIYSVIDNGVKAISGQGKITVDIKNKQERYIEIDISDTGCGISQDKIDSIFEYGKSFWIDKKGTGYGLWRARSIIQSMKGNIKVAKNKEGEGTTFTITLPIE